MTFVCLWSPRWSIAGAPLADLATALLQVAPRVMVDGRGVIWADGRGLPAPRLAGSMLDLAGWVENGVKAGVSAVAVAAEAAARSSDGPVRVVDPGREREFLASLPLRLVEADPRLLGLLEGVGVQSCGELASLEREAVEVRFGPRAAALWRLARADDPRLLFQPIPRELPNAAMHFVSYEVRQAERLLFTTNGLLGSVCAALEARGERAREMVLTLSLSSGGTVREGLRTARPTAERAAWVRRIREKLEALRLPDAVVGIELQVGGMEPASGTQGDLFDRGFSTAAPVEEAVIRLMDRSGILFVEPEVSDHPILERRTRWRIRPPEEAAETRAAPAGEVSPALSLQLLSEPRRIAVKQRLRRDHAVPVEYYDGRGWHDLTTAAGPDRVSGGQWEEAPYAREYYRCTTAAGVLVWLFHDTAQDAWYLHGWWD